MKKLISSTTFLAIFCCLLWATPFVGIKIGLNYTTPLQFAGLRFTVSGLLILPFIPNIKQRFKESFKHWPIMVNIALVQTTILYSLFYIGLDMVPGYVGAMIVGSGPIFVALTAHFMIKDDKMTLKKFLAIFVGIIGVVIISLAKHKEPNIPEDAGSTIQHVANSYPWLTRSITLGVIILIIKNLFGSIGNVLIAKNSKGVYPRVLAAFSLFVGGILILIISEFIEHPSWSTDLPLEFYISWGWLSIVSSFAIAIWYSLLQRPGVKVSILNVWTFIIPIFGAILSWLILPGESPDLASIIGMCVIGVSLLLINYFNRKNSNCCTDIIKSSKKI
ncbi:MAG: DMT family transporter [Candidatus Paceibacterota bacterium]